MRYVHVDENFVKLQNKMESVDCLLGCRQHQMLPLSCELLLLGVASEPIVLSLTIYKC